MPAPDERSDATDDGVPLPDAFGAVARELRHRAVRAFAPLDVTPGQVRALRVLTHHGEMRMSALSEHLRIAPRSGTEVADDLERRGLVRRRPDPDDRRAVLVALTDEGVRVADRVRAARDAEGDAYFAVLAEADRRELARILRVLRENAGGTGVS